MADEIMADVSEDRNLQKRPLHHAYLRCKLPWPHTECRGDARKVFFEEKGLAQHFRIKHARVVFDNVKQVREAWRLFRYLHGEETKEHSRRLSAERQQRNDSCERFIVATVYEGCRVLEVVAKDARECAKLVGVMLMHYG
ncbi:unnamed protein product [Porites lobata]|uniref:Uncharacterized protein n=1 Tax=Porites lobata TaxID=104759 RepID=A0ABN8QCL1_9CNID|nr:unnamed protein product [Porites lobata]